MEETIGYEALFSASEWNAIITGDYSEFDREAAEELGEGGHETTISAGRGSSDHLYDVWCCSCEHVAPADTLEQAQAIARLHEAFVATLADEWDIDKDEHRAAVSGSDGGFEIDCCDCGPIGSATDSDTADLLKRLHDRAAAIAARTEP